MEALQETLKKGIYKGIENNDKIFQGDGLVANTGRAFNDWIKDMTGYNENVQTKNWEQLIEEAKKRDEENYQKAIEREDAIRKETQEREDTAVRRWAEDAEKAGFNLNQVSQIGSAESGGGITTAQTPDYTTFTQAQALEMEEIMKKMEQEFEMNENAKDRITNVIRNLVIGGSFVLKKK